MIMEGGFTSSELPVMISAESLFFLKLLSSVCASDLVDTLHDAHTDEVTWCNILTLPAGRSR